MNRYTLFLISLVITTCSCIQGDPNIIYLAENETTCIYSSSYQAYEIKISNVSFVDNLMFDIYYDYNLNYIAIASDFDSDGIFRINYCEPSYLGVCTTALATGNYTYKIKFYSDPPKTYGWLTGLAYTLIFGPVIIGALILVLCMIAHGISNCRYE
jgi:hypothetical protein